MPLRFEALGHLTNELRGLPILLCRLEVALPQRHPATLPPVLASGRRRVDGSSLRPDPLRPKAEGAADDREQGSARNRQEARHRAVDSGVDFDADFFASRPLERELHAVVRVRSVSDTAVMGNRVPKGDRLSQVAVAARIRALSATPPAPAAGEWAFESRLPDWLRAITPVGADVLYTNTSVLPLTAAEWTQVEPSTKETITTNSDGTRVHHIRATANAHKPPHLPSQAPRPEQRARQARIALAWQRAHALALALVAAGVGERGIGRTALRTAETTLWLASGGVREPGVPIYDRLPNEAVGDLELRRGNLLEGKRFGRNGAPILRIECAVSRDLAAAPMTQLSRAQDWLGHTDVRGNPGNPSEAKRAVREGRKLLHRLGAWPWAHADKGRLHKHPEWWADPQFLDPLRQWIAQSWGRFIFFEVARARQALELEGSDGVEKAAAEGTFNLLADRAAEIVVAFDADRLIATLAGEDPPR